MRKVLLLLSTFVFSNALAWGPDGHAVVGMLAIKQLDPRALEAVENILSAVDDKSIGAACNWPDKIKNTAEGQWSSPLHYINIPRSQSSYVRERDCPQGKCATEAIKRYAARLGDQRLDLTQRRQAFSWVCHLLGDLHQPLHAGYRDDRGGNHVNIVFNNEPINLHAYWDSRLILSKDLSRKELVNMLPAKTGATSTPVWQVSEPDQWTEESHALVAQYSYPPGGKITADFSQQSWLLIQQQLATAADRLAKVLNATLGDGEVSPR